MTYNITDLTNQVKSIFKYNWDCKDDELNYIEEMMREWEKNKRHIYEAFGHQLIFELPGKEYSMKLSTDTKRSKVNELCDWIEENLFDVPNCFELTDFISAMGEELYNNIVPYDYGFFDIESDCEKVISAGSKITKAFKNFISDKNILTEIQNRTSAILQEDKISGKICFSIHPLDFLTMSNNTYRWTTCQELQDGERRMGALSYMLDTSTFVCYIKGADNVKLPVFPDDILWNSKKWRVLVHTNITHSIFMLGRPYPFELAEMRNLVHQSLPQLFSDIKHLSDWQIEKTIFNDYGDGIGGYFNIFDSIFLKEKLVCLHENSLNYNDLLYSTIYEPYLCYDINRDVGLQPMFVGNRVKCFKCGIENIKSSMAYLCPSCSTGKEYPYFFCGRCGKPLENARTQKIIVTNRLSRKTLCEDCYKDYIIGKYYQKKEN